ncbi:MAG: hypothetical protein LLF89_04960 [Spirochaetaceae bacterium]|nr:hypothetical protein [Spirochaetaceae bacterium]
MRQIKGVLVVTMLVFALGSVQAGPADNEFWSDNFLGLSWDLAGSFSDKAISFSKAQINDISLFFTYGNRYFPGFFPLRARAGIGWWKGQPWTATLGFELPLFESLSASQTRHFGVYLFGDGHFRFPASTNRFSFEPTVRLLIPLAAAGGLALGFGYDTSLGPTWHFEMMNGAYMVR